MGDRRAAFEAVYRATYGQITAYVARRCGSSQDAADVVAETYTVAWRRMRELPDGEEATLWLYGVARKVLANHYRGEVRRQARSVELDAEMADLYAATPDSGVELRAIAQIFRLGHNFSWCHGLTFAFSNSVDQDAAGNSERPW